MAPSSLFVHALLPLLLIPSPSAFASRKSLIELEHWVNESLASVSDCRRFEVEAASCEPGRDKASAEAALELLDGYPATSAAARKAYEMLSEADSGDIDDPRVLSLLGKIEGACSPAAHFRAFSEVFRAFKRPGFTRGEQDRAARAAIRYLSQESSSIDALAATVEQIALLKGLLESGLLGVNAALDDSARALDSQAKQAVQELESRQNAAEPQEAAEDAIFEIRSSHRLRKKLQALVRRLPTAP